MTHQNRLTEREWVLVSVFLALFISLIIIAYFSDHKVDPIVEEYMKAEVKQTF